MNRHGFARLAAAALLLASLSLHPPAPASAQPPASGSPPAPAPLGGSVFVVDETGDIITQDDLCGAAASDCPLRKAVELANASPGNTISFATGVFTGTASPEINVFLSPLAALTQPGTRIIATPAQHIKINFNLVGTGLQLNADDILVDGVGLYGAGTNIVVLQAADRQTTIRNTLIGRTGATCPLPQGIGIDIAVGSGQTTNASSAVTIQNNQITCGDPILGNGQGIRIVNGRNILIGGTGANQGNTITGNDTGISVGAGSQQVSIIGNRVIDNLLNGIELTDARNTRIGGNSAAHRNVISGNDNNGIAISGAQATDNVISGNYIGVASNGTTPQPNGNGTEATSNGVSISGGANRNTIGGGTATELNLIAGNTGNGIMISGAFSNTVFFNDIGFSSASNDLPLPNGRAGIKLTAGAATNIIGPPGAEAPPPLPGAANFIWHNNEAGIEIDGANNNSINGNSLRKNAFGVQLLNATGNGVYRARLVENEGPGISEGAGASNNYWSELSTANNTGGGIDKTAATPAPPVITAASRISAITYRVSGTSAAGATVEVYFADERGSAREGGKFAGRAVASGTNWTLDVTLPAEPPSHSFLAIQTTGSGATRNSSEFSAQFFARVYAPLILR